MSSLRVLVRWKKWMEVWNPTCTSKSIQLNNHLLQRPVQFLLDSRDCHIALVLIFNKCTELLILKLRMSQSEYKKKSYERRKSSEISRDRIQHHSWQKKIKMVRLKIWCVYIINYITNQVQSLPPSSTAQFCSPL